MDDREHVLSGDAHPRHLPVSGGRRRRSHGPRHRSTPRPRGGRATRSWGRRGSRRARRAPRLALVRRRCRAPAAPARPGCAGPGAEPAATPTATSASAGLGEPQGAVRRVVGDETALETVDGVGPPQQHRGDRRDEDRRRPRRRAGEARTTRAAASSGECQRPGGRQREAGLPERVPESGCVREEQQVGWTLAQPCAAGSNTTADAIPSSPMPLPNATASRTAAGRPSGCSSSPRRAAAASSGGHAAYRRARRERGPGGRRVPFGHQPGDRRARPGAPRRPRSHARCRRRPRRAGGGREPAASDGTGSPGNGQLGYAVNDRDVDRGDRGERRGRPPTGSGRARAVHDGDPRSAVGF